MWDEITDPFLNFNGCTVEVKEWISVFHPALYWVCDYLSMLGLKLIHVSKSGHWTFATIGYVMDSLFLIVTKLLPVMFLPIR